MSNRIQDLIDLFKSTITGTLSLLPPSESKRHIRSLEHLAAYQILEEYAQWLEEFDGATIHTVNVFGLHGSGNLFDQQSEYLNQGWGQCLEWIEAVWQGRVEEVLLQMTQWLATQEPLDADISDEDPRYIVQSSVMYLTNNGSRMNYPAYRSAGLPTTSSLMESLVKEINWRVKGSEKFWNTPAGATPILSLKPAALSEDDRLERMFP